MFIHLHKHHLSRRRQLLEQRKFSGSLCASQSVGAQLWFHEPGSFSSVRKRSEYCCWCWRENTFISCHPPARRIGDTITKRKQGALSRLTSKGNLCWPFIYLSLPYIRQELFLKANLEHFWHIAGPLCLRNPIICLRPGKCVIKIHNSIDHHSFIMLSLEQLLNAKALIFCGFVFSFFCFFSYREWNNSLSVCALASFQGLNTVSYVPGIVMKSRARLIQTSLHCTQGPQVFKQHCIFCVMWYTNQYIMENTLV